MRIISGALKGRRFELPGHIPVRPTTDFAKTGLFNILDNRIDYATINALDLCHGTGSISLELASRGCPSIVSVDLNYACHAFLKKAAGEFHLPINTIKGDALKFVNQLNTTFDLIFADPPFDWPYYPQLVNLIYSKAILSPGGTFVIEHDSRHHFAQYAGFVEERHYGKVQFSFFNAGVK